MEIKSKQVYKNKQSGSQWFVKQYFEKFDNIQLTTGVGSSKRYKWVTQDMLDSKFTLVK